MNRNSDFETALTQMYRKFEKEICSALDYGEVLDIGVKLQREMEELNIKYRLWDDTKGYDYDSIYYTADFIVRNCYLSEICSLDKDDVENRKKVLSNLLFQKIDRGRKKIIHVIEPHPDDAFGSASGLCYSPGAVVTLHTMSRVIDERDLVNLDQQTFGEYESIRKKPNIIAQYKYSLDDYHWDNRYLGRDLTYESLAGLYAEKYGKERFSRLMDAVGSIIKTAVFEDAYVAFPLGIEHPMHILAAYACVEQIKKQKLALDRVIVYVDHPYDYQNAGTPRLQNAKNYIQSALGLELVRCDDISIDQSALAHIITEIYGADHYGEFDGALENTMCSYYVNEPALENVKAFLDIHVNNILYITAQAKPFMKTGGLGEVAYGLCKAMQDFVNDVRILMPEYTGEGCDCVPDVYDEEIRSFLYEGSTNEIGNIQCEIKKRTYQGLIYYLLDIKDYFGKDNLFDAGRHGQIFAVFCDAIMQKGLNALDYLPSVLHCNDWQTALIPMLKKTKYNYYRPDLKVIYTIHFYGYKGIFKKERILGYVGMDPAKCRLCISCGENCKLDKIDLLSNDDIGKLNVTPSQMSFMKAGIEFADIVTTVSKGYGEELQGYPDFTNIKVVGIRNGCSSHEYHFAEDSGFVSVGSDNFLSAKRGNKDKLQLKLGLERDFNIPLICMVSRLTVVKGIEVVKNILQEILSIPAQVVIIGDDDDKIGQPYANFFKIIEAANPGKFVYKHFSEELEYETYAGADILLMPSLSEACGTTQINAMRYGVIPIVSMISAFKDTVLDFKDRGEKKNADYWDKGIGFYAYKEDCWVLLEVIKKAVEIYQNKDHRDTWADIGKDCIKVDFSWKNKSILEYLKLYNGIGLTGR